MIVRKRDQESILGFFEDSSTTPPGYASEVVFPETEWEISQVLREANVKGIPVTISGAGTGNTGARIPRGGIVVASDRLNKVLYVKKEDNGRGYLVTQPGVRLSEIRRVCAERGLLYPPDPTEESAFIGGTLATNASGARGFKFGSTRNYVRRVRIVLADGEVVELRRGKMIVDRDKIVTIRSVSGKEIRVFIPGYRSPDVKNASGYFSRPGMDIIEPFIGHEGTLGMYSEIELQLIPRPEGILSFFVFFKTDDRAFSFVQEVRDKSIENRQAGNQVGINVMSLEYFDHNSIRLLREKFHQLPKDQCAVFFEQDVDSSTEDRVVEDLLAIFESLGISIDDTWVAQGAKENREFREIRHELPVLINEWVRQEGRDKLSIDISVPRDRMFEMVDFYKDSFSENGIYYVMFGHIGSSHLHVNLFPKTEVERLTSTRLYRSFVERAVSFGGTVSAEHGIGKVKHDYLKVMYGEWGLREMVKMKLSLDPNGILCQGNIFSKELLDEVRNECAEQRCVVP